MPALSSHRSARPVPVNEERSERGLHRELIHGSGSRDLLAWIVERADGDGDDRGRRGLGASFLGNFKKYIGLSCNLRFSCENDAKPPRK